MAAVGPPRPLFEDDDQTKFDCGRESINQWFRRHAWLSHASGTSRVNVLPDPAQGRIAGFVTLSAAQIERAFMPKARQRNRPSLIPVTLLGQLAADRDYQGQGLGAALLYFALKTALEASDKIGSMGVITHPLDDGVRRFYARWGFADLPFDPHRAMMVRMEDLRLSFATGTAGPTTGPGSERPGSSSP